MSNAGERLSIIERNLRFVRLACAVLRRSGEDLAKAHRACEVGGDVLRSVWI